MDTWIEAVIERELGDTAVITEKIDEGLMQDTYEIRFRGEDYILQISPPNTDNEASLKRGLECYRLLGRSEIPVPEPVTDEVGEFQDRKYVIVEKLPGASGKLDISPERVRHAGRILAKIHNVETFENAGRLQFDDHGLSIGEFSEGSLEEWQAKHVRTTLDRTRGSELEAVATEIDRLRDADLLEHQQDFEPVLCHNDYSPDNVVFLDGEITGIVDFDLAYAGDPQWDIVKAANGFWMHDPCTDWNVRETFYEGYQDVNPLGNTFDENEQRIRVKTLAKTVSGMLERGKLSDYEKEFYADHLFKYIDRISPT